MDDNGNNFNPGSMPVADCVLAVAGWNADVATGDDQRIAPDRQAVRRRARDRRSGLNSRAEQRVRRFLENSLGERFTLADMADAACMSRFHFARMFRISFGISPMDYVLRRRVEQAKQVLRRQDTTIASVAASLGFCDQSHFTRSFKRITGCSPRQFIAGQGVPGGRHGMDTRPALADCG